MFDADTFSRQNARFPGLQICAMIESASPWSGIEVVITALTRNRPGDLEHPLAEPFIFQGFPGLEKVRTSCFLS